MFHAGVVYGSRGEVFENKRGASLEDFIKTTFEIENVFKSKLVMGRCICHGKRTLETDLLLGNEEDALKFISSHESKKPHVILIYDKYAESSLEQSQTPQVEDKGGKSIQISHDQWNDLMSSIRNLELSLNSKQEAENQKKNEPINETLHANIFCDGCSLPHDPEAKEIRGTRYKCLTCSNFDLCDICESKGFENATHKRNHNMLKIKNCSFIDMERHSRSWGRVPRPQASNDDREIVLDIPEEDKELFEAFSNVDQLKVILNGYKSFSKLLEKYGSEEKITRMLDESLQANKVIHHFHVKSNDSSSHKHRVRQHSNSRKAANHYIKVELTKKDKTLFFKLCNRGKTSIPGGLFLRYSLLEADSNETKTCEVCKLSMGPHDVLPGKSKTFKFNYFEVLPDIKTSQKSEISVVDLDGETFYKGVCGGEEGSHFVMEKQGGLKLSDKLQEYVELNSSNDTFQLLEKEDSDGIISSNLTNDEETMNSSSGQATNWEDYDFLSESDV